MTWLLRNRSRLSKLAAGVLAALSMGAASLLTAGAAGAELVQSGTNTNTNGAQTITWTSAFSDDRYVVGDTVTVPVTWVTDCGATSGSDVTLRGTGFSPDGVTGTTPRTVVASANALTFEFEFTSLHQPGRRGVAKGNAQFLVHVQIDQDCDGIVDGTAQLGVNVHVATGDSEAE